MKRCNMMPNEMSNEELASKLEKVLPGNYYIVEAAARIRELEELKFNHLPKVEHALQRANTEGMKCDETIADLRSRLREAENGFEAITNMEGTSTMRFYAKKFLRQIRGEDDRVIVEYKGKRYVRKIDSNRVFDVTEIDGDVFLRLQDANDEKKQTILLKEIEDKKPELYGMANDGLLAHHPPSPPMVDMVWPDKEKDK